MTNPFAARSPADILALVKAQPLALVVSHGAEDFRATPLPLLPETDEAGEITSFLGHFALANPQVPVIRADPRVLILFQGPHGYISPRGISNRSWAPTWNYALVQFEAELRFVPEENDHAIQSLVAAMEGDGEAAWRTTEIGPRYAKLLPHIIAFRADVRATRARFKLGQDETPQTFDEILTEQGETPLAAMMRAFNSP
jgi:transcriptional regulator